MGGGAADVAEGGRWPRRPDGEWVPRLGRVGLRGGVRELAPTKPKLGRTGISGIAKALEVGIPDRPSPQKIKDG